MMIVGRGLDPAVRIFNDWRFQCLALANRLSTLYVQVPAGGNGTLLCLASCWHGRCRDGHPATDKAAFYMILHAVPADWSGSSSRKTGNGDWEPLANDALWPDGCRRLVGHR